MTEERDTPMELLERWVAQHQPVVYKAAYLVLRDHDAAEDVAQEAFIRAYRAADRLEPGSNVRSWLYKIATNTALNRLRSRRREVRALARIGRATDEDGHVDPTEEQTTRSAVEEALERLPERLRVPVVLRYYLDLPVRDIAWALRVRPGTVKSRLHEARRRLAEDADIAVAAGEAG